MTLKFNKVIGKTAAILIGLVGLSSASGALLTLDVQAVSTQIGSNGAPTAVADAKNVSVTSAGEIVNFNVYAEITDADSNHSDDSITSVAMRITSAEAANGLMGDISGVAAPSSFNLTNVGQQGNLDSNPDLEWGDTRTTSTTKDFDPLSTNKISSDAGPSGETEVLIGSFQWTLTSTLTDNISTMINVQPYINSSNKGAYSFFSDNVQYLNRNSTDVGAGIGVTLTAVTPEPASLSLLGLVASGLLMRRRSKRSGGLSA